MSFLNDFEDLDIFTSGEFSTVATVESANSSQVELSGIFDENYQDMFGGFADSQSEGRKFCFQVQTLALEGIGRSDRLTIEGKKYQIVSLQPQHDGKLTYLVLKQDFS